jgi:TolA-binding protein
MRLWGAAFVVLLAAGPLQAQIAPEEQARRLLEDGRTAWREGKAKQALDNFNTIVTGFPGTSSVDDALLEIGRYHAEVDRDPARAKEAFEQVAKRFPQSDGAPGAYWQLGWLTLNAARTTADLDDAVAQFARVQRLYPRSDWVPRALHSMAIAHRRAGRLPEAVAAARRAVLEYPGSDAAPSAQLELGQALALAGRPAAAMEAFQDVRNRWPDSPLAPQALDRTTALYRLHGGSKPSFAVDPSYTMPAGDVLKDVRAMVFDPAGSLWLASNKVGAAVPFTPEGKMGASISADEPRTLTLGPAGEIVLAAKTAVRVGLRDIRAYSVPDKKPGVMEPLEEIGAAVPFPGGGMLVADGKSKRVLRFDDASKLVGPFPDATEREVVRLVVDPEGVVLMLDKDKKNVTVVDKTGKVLRTLGPTGAGYNLRKPVDLAVDAFRNLYVVDEEAGVLVLDSQGKLLATLAGEEIRKPRAVTIDASGGVLVYDGEKQRVVRFR